MLEVRRRLGYVIQDGGLFPHLSARDNVILMARYLGWEAGRITKRLAELAELTRFPVDGLDRFPAAAFRRPAAARQPDARADARPQGDLAR